MRLRTVEMGEGGEQDDDVWKREDVASAAKIVGPTIAA